MVDTEKTPKMFFVLLSPSAYNNVEYAGRASAASVYFN